MVAVRPVSPALQCPAPMKTPPKLSMLGLEDAELDNPMIAEDEKILPARKCGFCMG